MEDTRTIELSRGKVIPDFVLPRCDTEEPFELRSLKPRHNVVLVFAHGDQCEQCRAPDMRLRRTH